MAKEEFKRDRPNVNVGTVGHVDHGKTTLTAAITMFCANRYQGGQSLSFSEIDNAPEEKARGITINSRTVEYATEKRHYTHVDCPGHADYIKNMITASRSLDIAILLVDASTGAQKQTFEHVLLLARLQVKNILVVLNKADLLSADEREEMLELAREDVLGILIDQGFEESHIHFVSGSAFQAYEAMEKAAKGTDFASLEQTKFVQEILDTLDTMPEPSRAVDEPFLFFIEAVYSITGRGNVAAGLIERGTVKPGDAVDLVGWGDHAPVIIKEIEMFRKTLKEAVAGDNVGILLGNVPKEIDLRRGHALVKTNSVPLVKNFVADIYILSKEEGGRSKPFYDGYEPQFYFHTLDIPGKILAINKDESVFKPGEHTTVKVELLRPMAVYNGANFAVREGGLTVLVGKVTEITVDPTKKKK